MYCDSEEGKRTSCEERAKGEVLRNYLDESWTENSQAVLQNTKEGICWNRLRRAGVGTMMLTLQRVN